MSAYSVTGGARRRVLADEVAYVYAGGVVEADGGRVLVGSGGRCVAGGSAMVTLVEDGLSEHLPHRPPPEACLRGGQLHAEAGTGYLDGAASYTATGTARIVAAPTVRGGVEDGRLVAVRLPEPGEIDSRCRALLAGEVAGSEPRMEPEPSGDGTEWLGPLLTALAEAGGTVRRRHGFSRGAVVHEVRAPGSPVQLVAAADQQCALPPSLKLVVRGDEAELVSDWGVGVRVTGRGGGTRARWT
jgi:hypothetical protein